MLRNAAGLLDPAYWKGTLQPRPILDWCAPPQRPSLPSLALTSFPFCFFLSHPSIIIPHVLSPFPTLPPLVQPSPPQNLSHHGRAVLEPNKYFYTESINPFYSAYLISRIPFSDSEFLKLFRPRHVQGRFCFLLDLVWPFFPRFIQFGESCFYFIFLRGSVPLYIPFNFFWNN